MAVARIAGANAQRAEIVSKKTVLKKNHKILKNCLDYLRGNPFSLGNEAARAGWFEK